MSLSRAAVTALALLLGCARPTLPEPHRPLVVTPDAPFRKAPPPLAPLAHVVADPLPPVETATLASGLSLWVLHRPRLPYVALMVASRDAGTLRGLAPVESVRLTTRSVVEGGTVWSQQRVVAPPLINGEGVISFSEPLYSGFRLRVTTGSLDSGVALLGRTLQAPAFGRGNIDDVKLAELKRMQNSSNALTSALFEVTVESALGEAPAQPLLGLDMDQVRRLGSAWVERHYRELFRPESSVLIAVGDVTLPTILPLVERDFGGWQTTRPRPSETERAAMAYRTASSRVHFLPQPDRGQADVLLLQPAPAAGATRDELAYLLMAELAMGAFTSRANASLRHQAGITYGLSPTIVSGPELGLFAITASFEADETKRALQDLQRMLRALREAPVKRAELELAKVALLSQLERETHSNQSLARYLAQAFAEGKSAGWVAALPAEVAAVTPADLQRVALTYLRPEQLEVGVAGPPALATQLAGFGPVEIYRAQRSGAWTEPPD